MYHGILGAGSYTLALTADDNYANGPTYGDGFFRSGQGDFTGPTFRGLPGAFILADGSQRTPFWAVDILGVDAASVPPPGVPAPPVLVLVAAGILVARVAYRKLTRV